MGDTYEDVVQVFSQTSDRLHRQDSITLQDLHFELFDTYNGTGNVSNIKRIAN